MNRIGLVTIGRNEGERLVLCLKSLTEQLQKDTPIVYVDSGSTDGSVEVAKSFGVNVIELDLSIPLSASRGRNAGFNYLRQNFPHLEYVQFLDGDCELMPGWLNASVAELKANPKVVAVCGWRRERFPDQSAFNRICDVEWQMGSVGVISNFGGDVMIRAEALGAVGGYDNSVIAAEDDELGVRLRQAGGILLRIDKDCTWHDAAMYSLWQWWQRAIRGGYGYAQVSFLHGVSPECKFVAEIRRIWLWGAIVPILAFVLAPFTHGLSCLSLLRYPLTALRVTYKTRKQGFSWQHSLSWGISCTMSPFPGVIGAGGFYLNRLDHKQHKIIEYKRTQIPANPIIESKEKNM